MGHNGFILTYQHFTTRFIGDAVMINNRISLTRDQRSMRGTLWSRNRIQERDWEAQVRALVIY